MENKFITLTWSLIREKETTMQEKLILMEINNLSMLKYGCIAMNEHFAELLGVKKNAISRHISSLEEKGYITSKIRKGSRNFSREITINKMLFNPSQNVIQPITKCEETKENITSNITSNIKTSKKDEFSNFLNQLERACKYKTKVSKTKEGLQLFNSIQDKKKLFTDYIKHQEEKENFSVRITAYMKDYETVYANQSNEVELTDAEIWSQQ